MWDDILELGIPPRFGNFTETDLPNPFAPMQPCQRGWSLVFVLLFAHCLVLHDYFTLLERKGLDYAPED